MTIALLFGGASNEHLISCLSAATLLTYLKETGHRPLPIGITQKGEWRLYQGPTQHLTDGTWESAPDTRPLVLSPKNGLYTEQGKHLPIDVCLPCIHGQYGEDGILQGVLEALSLPYIGCGVESSALAMNKRLTKLLAQEAGIPTLPHIPLKRGQPAPYVPLPAFCKATRSGSSIGTALATTREELATAIETALSVDGEGLAEPYLIGREVEVAVFDDGERIVSHPAEILKDQPYYDYESKYGFAPAKTCLHPSLSEKIIEQLQRYASLAFDALGCRHLARVDFFLDGDAIYLNEVNTLPGFTKDSLYPAMMEKAGLPPKALLERLIRRAYHDWHL